MHTRDSIVMLIALLCVALFNVGVQADNNKPVFSSDPASVQSRLDNVRRLVTNSSGARRIIEGSDLGAKALRNEAELSLRNAEKAYESGEMTKAQDELQSATEKMFSAVRSVGTGKDGIDKQKRDFEYKAESVNVLLKAVERIAKEKGENGKVLERANSIRGDAAAAQATANMGNLADARAQIDRSYDQAKQELERLREGETLVRSLNFETPQDEYLYELDRNDTHKMLLKVLLTDDSKSAGMQKLIDGFVDRSGKLRQKAEGQAGSGAFKEAIKSLEESTKYLQRAIRSAGVYIPG